MTGDLRHDMYEILVWILRGLLVLVSGVFLKDRADIFRRIGALETSVVSKSESEKNTVAIDDIRARYLTKDDFIQTFVRANNDAHSEILMEIRWMRETMVQHIAANGRNNRTP